MSPNFARDDDPRPTVARLLADPTVRRCVKAVLLSWADRDPVDAAEYAGLLALALERRADEACGLDLIQATHHLSPHPDPTGG